MWRQQVTINEKVGIISYQDVLDFTNPLDDILDDIEEFYVAVVAVLVHFVKKIGIQLPFSPWCFVRCLQVLDVICGRHAVVRSR